MKTKHKPKIVQNHCRTSSGYDLPSRRHRKNMWSQEATEARQIGRNSTTSATSLHAADPGTLVAVRVTFFDA